MPLPNITPEEENDGFEQVDTVTAANAEGAVAFKSLDDLELVKNGEIKKSGDLRIKLEAATHWIRSKAA